MSIRKMISLAGVVCVPLSLTWLLCTLYLPDAEQVEDYTGYVVTLPTVTYSNIMRTVAVAHKEGVAAEEDPGCVINDSYSDLSRELNLYLYDVCQAYASGLTCAGFTLSPLLPLAEANLEGGRVDTSETFSAMASTSVYDFSSVEELKALDVTRVLDSEDTWLAMSREYYTRDRGALQCNTNYSGNDPSYGASEYSLLATYIAEHPEVLNYRSNSDSRGNRFSVAEWVNSSRTKYGDRFNVESMVRMFVDEKALVEIPSIEANFSSLQNEYQVYTIMAYNHWIGSGFMTMDEDIAYAGFRTIGRAYEYCADISTPKAIEIIYSQCLQDIQSARSKGKNPPKCLGMTSAYRVYNLLVDEGVCKDWDYYFRHKYTGSWDQGDTACTYALGVIYGVMQMSLLYSGY